MGVFLTIILLAGLMIAFGRRLPGPRWLWKILRIFAIVVLSLCLGFIALMLIVNFFDMKWH